MQSSKHHKLAHGCVALGVAAVCGLAAVVGAATAPDPAHGAARPARPPNIVLVQTDDQTVGQLTWQAMPKTKRLLTRHGTTFNDYMATTAECCPSRASLLTGQYAHNHGIFSSGRGEGYPRLIDKGNVLPVWLQAAGYHTIHVGKFMNHYQQGVPDRTEVAPGWDDWQTTLSGVRYYNYGLSNNGKLVHYGDEDSDYVTRVLTRKSVNAVRKYAPDKKPFYLQVDQRAPHTAIGNRPGRCGGGDRAPFAEPDPTDIDRFRSAKVPRPPSYNEDNLSDKPEFLRGTRRLDFSRRRRIRAKWRCALATLAGVDRSVARIYKAVDDAGELRRTAFIFIGDNGLFYGEHRIEGGKVLPYEEALRQPLIVSLPKRFREGGVRRTVGEPVANIDLAPTILALAHGRSCTPQASCRTMDGRSLMPLLTGGGHWPNDRMLLTEYRSPAPDRHKTCNFAGVRTPRTIYVEHYSVGDPTTGQCQATLQVERYDLQSDPYELENRCFGGLPTSCPKSQRQVELEQELQQMRNCAGVKGRDQRVGGRPYCG
ncbi:MAG: sulfatase [Solirubrobacterales bacterium]